MRNVEPRRVTCWLVCAVLVMSAAAGLSAEQKDETVPEGYEVRNVEGWTLYVGETLLEDHPQLARKALRIAGNQLFNVKRVLPGQAVEKLQRVTIWMQYRCKDQKCACYHPSRRWLVEHNYNPAKAKSVDIGNATNFVRWSEHQWWMVLHELAHAYHDQVLGFNNPRVEKAYRRVKEAGLYDDVLQWRGHSQKHYALNNAREYFAEMTEAFYGTNDFYPFVRAELKDHDPETLRLIRELWRSPDKFIQKDKKPGK